MNTVKRWCGRAAAGTETASMNPMVEAHGDADEDTHYVLASDYEALERLLIERQHDLITRNTELFQARRMLDDEFTRTLRQTSKLSEATKYAVALEKTLRSVRCALSTIHDRCIDNVDVDEDASGHRTPNTEGHVVCDCTVAIEEIDDALAKNPSPSDHLTIRGFGTQKPEASGSVGLGPIPKGYHIVPLEPTDEMLAAGTAAAEDFGTPYTRVANGWKAMVNASPALAIETIEHEALRTVVGVALGWVPVAERLPAEGQQVLIYAPNAVDPMHVVIKERIDTNRSPSRDKDFGYWGPQPITHWMPLPEAP